MMNVRAAVLNEEGEDRSIVTVELADSVEDDLQVGVPKPDADITLPLSQHDRMGVAEDSL